MNITTGFEGIEIPCRRLWQNIISSPEIPIIREGVFNKKVVVVCKFVGL
jgi:hypothetical protein